MHDPNDAEEFKRVYLFKKSNANVAKVSELETETSLRNHFHVQQHDAQGKENSQEGANLDQSCHQRDNVTPLGARH